MGHHDQRCEVGGVNDKGPGPLYNELALPKICEALFASRKSPRGMNFT